MPGEVLAQRVQQLAVLRVDGADPAEAEVVLPDLLEALPGMPLPRVTFSRKGTTSSGPSGPPKDSSSRASYGLAAD